MISVKSNVKDVERYLSKTQKRYLPRAIEFSLNETVFLTRKKMLNDMGKYIDRPTPYTKKGLQYLKADARKANLTSWIGFVSPSFGKKPKGGAMILPSEYMKLLTYGGTRQPRKSKIGVPTEHLKLNKYGNIGKGKIKTILNKPKTFQATIKGNPGIWERYGSKRNPKIRMLIGWESKTDYDAIYPFSKQVSTGVNKFYKKSFSKFLKDVLTRKGVGWIPKKAIIAMED
jgi:hypothetical protein